MKSTEEQTKSSISSVTPISKSYLSVNKVRKQIESLTSVALTRDSGPISTTSPD